MTVTDYIISHRAANKRSATSLAWRYHMDPDEVYQDAVERALKYSNKYSELPTASFTGWFYRVAWSVCMDQYNREKRLPKFSAIGDLSFDDGLTAERREEMAITWWRLRQRFGRAALPLYMYAQGYKYEEISAQLGENITTIKSWMIRCRRYINAGPEQPVVVREKQCRSCELVKPVEEFYRHGTTADKFFHECKKCIKNRNKVRSMEEANV